MSTESENKALVAAAFEAWAAGTGNPFDLLTDDATWTITGSNAGAGTFRGKEELFDKTVVPFAARLGTPLVPELQLLVAEGDTVVARFEATATANDGSPYRNTYAWFLTMSEGRITEVIAFFDGIEFDDYWNRVTPKSA